jgi:hypothetical protein
LIADWSKFLHRKLKSKFLLAKQESILAQTIDISSVVRVYAFHCEVWYTETTFETPIQA